MQRYDSLRLAMFSGKGGVGKTTLSCGFARRWARSHPQEQILLLSTDPAHSLGDVLQEVVVDAAHPLADLPNLSVRALDAQTLLQAFKARYGEVLELLVARGSFVQGEDLTPVWDLDWPGVDELMGILEIQRLLREQVVDRVVVDMAPSGHTLNLFGLMDFLDGFLQALELFQTKHQTVSQALTGRYTPDQADSFLQDMQADLAAGRQLLQDATQTACLVVAIAEPMSYLETQRFLTSLQKLQIPLGGIFVNHLLMRESGVVDDSPTTAIHLDRYSEQQEILTKFLHLVTEQPIFSVAEQTAEPVGAIALDQLFDQIHVAQVDAALPTPPPIVWPAQVTPGFTDFIEQKRRLILVGGKGGVGKTTVAAAIAWGMAQRHPDRTVRVISIDPAHSLGDAFGSPLGHQPTAITANLSAQEIDADQVLEQFREDYLWELAAMMSGEAQEVSGATQIAYGPEAWRQIVSQALPGIDEMLSLVAIMELLEQKDQDLIILDTAPTGHLLRFLEMPTALGDWLAWIFKLWIKYQEVLGQTDLMGRLRTLRQRVVQAQKKLKDPQHTEFVLVFQAQSAIIAEAQRLTQTLEQLSVSQSYAVQNRVEPDQPILTDLFPKQTVIGLPVLPRGVSALRRIEAAAELLAS